MCFSAAASFAASIVLFPLGLYSVYKALKTNKDYLLFSFIPIIFSIHQFIQGLIWDTLHARSYVSLYHSVLAFTFIAFFIWPFYIPLSIYAIEPNPRRKKIFLGLIFFGLALGLASYIPLLIGIISVDVAVVKHSISYPVYQPVYMQNIYTVFYVLIVVFSLFLSSIKEIRIFGMLLLSAFLFSAVCFYYAITSVWCFFAALLSLYIIYCINQLPPRDERNKLQ